MKSVCTRGSTLTDDRLAESSELQDNYALYQKTYHELAELFLPLQQEHPTHDDIQTTLKTISDMRIRSWNDIAHFDTNRNHELTALLAKLKRLDRVVCVY